MDFTLSKKHILILVILIVLSFFIGRYTKGDTIIKSKVLREDGYAYIRPVLLCNLDNQQEYNQDLVVNKIIKDYISKSKNEISIYFLNVTNGKWASINENLTFSPASMLKVPTIVDIFKLAEKNPEILNKKVLYDGSFNDNTAEYFTSLKSIKAGTSYTINDLIRYTIEESDNNASRLLHLNISSRSLEEIYKDLQIEIPQSTTDFMSAKTFALFLRVLYNSTYLGRDSSEKVLAMMTNSSFNNGLKAGVPKGIPVASKFGERQVFSSKGELLRKELHDCGIVYGDKQNYILCVMTRGDDLDKLANDISNISTLVYAEANK